MVCSFTDLSFTQLSFTVCAEAGGGAGKHDGLSRQFAASLQPIQPTRLKSRVGLLFKVQDITPDIEHSRIPITFTIIEKLKSKSTIQFNLQERLRSIAKIAFHIITSSNTCNLQFLISEPRTQKIGMGLVLQEKLSSRVGVLLKVRDSQEISKKLNSSLLPSDLTDLEALGITLIFEDDKNP